MQLTEDQLDALTEIVNIGVGRGAASLHSLVDQRIDLCVPRVRLCDLSGLESELNSVEEPVDTSVLQGFEGAISGRAMLAFPRRSGIALAKLLTEEASDESHVTEDALEFDLAEILEEIGNIVLNGVLGSLANMFEDNFQYSVPELYCGPASQALTRNIANTPIDEAPTCLLADARFDLADSQIGGSLLLAFNTNELSLLLNHLLEKVEG